MGHVVEVVSEGAIPFAWAVLILSPVMVAYEWLGGMRSVVWTNVLQGLIPRFSQPWPSSMP
jgi:Na+/proline symporter